MTRATSLSASTDTLTGKTSTEATSTSAAPLTAAAKLTTSPPTTAATWRAAAPPRAATTTTTTVRTSGLISRYWSDNRRMWNKTFRVFCRIRTDLDPRNFGGRLNFFEFDQFFKSPTH